MTPVLTVFEKSPDHGRGLARDMPVRWALEELGRAYDTRPLAWERFTQPEHRVRHPFGQIPVYEDGGLILFESGAIVLHLAQQGPAAGGAALLPADPDARARAVMWMFAALGTIEPPVVDYAMATFMDAGKPWQAERLEMLESRVRVRLGELSTWLGDAPWLEGDFSAGDLLAVCVLRRLGQSGLLEGFPRVAAYVARGEARAAFVRAFAAQLARFEDAAAQS